MSKHTYVCADLERFVKHNGKYKFIGYFHDVASAAAALEQHKGGL